MSQKTVRFNRQKISQLPNNKPVVYKILTPGGTNNYTGIAKRGRVTGRLAEHLPGGKDPIPGTKVVIKQASNIGEALSKEQRIIARTKPKYNQQGK